MADRIIFVCAIMLAALYFYATAQIPTHAIGDPLGPKVFPYLLGIGLLFASGLLLKEILQAKEDPKQVEKVEKKTHDMRHLLLIGGVTIWTIAYFAVFDTLGYLIATVIYLFVLMTYFHRGKWVVNGLTVVLFSIGSYFLFEGMLGVSLPSGLLNL